jgi:hypothetical protein
VLAYTQNEPPFITFTFTFPVNPDQLAVTVPPFGVVVGLTDADTGAGIVTVAVYRLLLSFDSG